MLITIQGEYIIEIMKECVEGKHGNMFDEVKVALLSFQNTPPRICPYLVCHIILRAPVRKITLARLLWIFVKSQQSKMVIQQP